MTFLLGMAAGAWLLGAIGVLWAVPEPWPDRLLIALFWPVAAIRIAWLDC